VTSRLVTPSQTVGPFFHDCMLRDDAIDDDEGGVRIRVSGRVLDGAGAGVPDAVIEACHGAGLLRVGTDEHGRFSFTTVRAEPVSFDHATMQAPHLSVAVFARGLLNHLLTRIYFEDEPSTAADPILGRVPEARRATLVARLEPGESLTRSYRFDIILQGDGETVFFDFRPRNS
jgi:protocatechuate 3,4-dioxygenase, alpha subunit